MPNIVNLSEDGQWFTEAELPYSKAGIRIGTKISKVLFDQPSQFGHVQVFDTPFYGRMLVIDGIIQVAEKDEFIYHEMMVILPAIKHGKPENVLVIGGGDGGAVKQALRIKSIKRIVLVEIDRSVIDVCKEYLPSIADGALEDNKVEIVIADGMEYANKCQEQFDIIALDLTDPIPDGPAAALYEEPFYRDIKRILTPNGIASTHCSSLVMQPDEAKIMIPRLERVFSEVVLHSAVIPSYQLTSFGFVTIRPNKVEYSEKSISSGLSNVLGESKYLSPEIFWSSSVIPPYIQQKIGMIS